MFSAPLLARSYLSGAAGDFTLIRNAGVGQSFSSFPFFFLLRFVLFSVKQKKKQRRRKEARDKVIKIRTSPANKIKK